MYSGVELLANVLSRLYRCELLRYAVEHNAYRGCAHPLLPHGKGEEEDDIAARLSQLAQQTLGLGDAAAMFPTFSSFAGDYDAYDDQPWRVML